MSEQTQDLAMKVAGVPVAFPPNGDDPKSFLKEKLRQIEKPEPERKAA
jgi:hypothetical protein